MNSELNDGINLHPKAEIKGVTIPTAIAFAIAIATVIITYSNVRNAVELNQSIMNELKATIKDQQTATDLQIRQIQIQQREQDQRLIRIEAKQEK